MIRDRGQRQRRRGGDGHDGTVLAFLNEVAGGRRLLTAIRERVDAGADAVALAAPQNQPVAGQIVDRDELREAAQSRVEVTEAVLAEFGIDAVGAVMDPDPSLALDDAVRAFRPSEVLLLGAARDPLRPRCAGPARVGEGALRRARHARPGPDRGRRDPLGRHAHARGRDEDGREPGAGREAEGEGGGVAAPLHDHLPALRRPAPRGGLRSARAAARRALPRRGRRDGAADEPGAVRRRSRTPSSTTGSTRS